MRNLSFGKFRTKILMDDRWLKLVLALGIIEFASSRSTPRRWWGQINMKQNGYITFWPRRDERRTPAESAVANARHYGQSAHVTTRACVPVDVNHASLPVPIGLSNGAATTAGGMVTYDRTLPWPHDLSSLVSTMGHAAAAVSDTVSLPSAKVGSETGTDLLATESMTVMTDQADYAPGSTATFVVTGFRSGSSVAFRVADLASAPGINGIADVYTPFSVMDGGLGDADGVANGIVVTQWQVPSDGRATGATLQLTTTSGNQIATTTFSDAPNRIVSENQKTGTPESIWAIHGSFANQGDSQIEGFATQISTNAGQAVSFKIDTLASGYTLDIYRLGYYGGNGARLVATTHHTGSADQPDPMFSELDQHC